MGRIGERLDGERREVADDRLGERIYPHLDPVVERQLRFAAEVLDRPLELSGVALGEELRGQLGVDDDDQTLVVGDRRPGPRGRQDLDLVGGQGEPGQVDAPVRLDRELAAPRGAAMIAGIRSPYFRPIRAAAA